MKKLSGEMFKDAAFIAASFSIACVTGSGFIPSVFLGIFGDHAKGIFSDHLKKYDSKRISSWFTTEHPDKLNHHLQMLLAEATTRALGHLIIMYRERSLESDEQTEKAVSFLKALARQVPQYFDPSVQIITEQHLDQYLYKDEQEMLRVFFRDVNHKQEYDQLSDRFKEFLSRFLIKQIQLCFAEGLKSNENQPAWIAFQRRLAEQAQEQMSSLIDGQHRIEQSINNLKLDASPFTAEELNSIAELKALLKSPAKIEEIVNQELEITIIELKSQLDRILLFTEQTHGRVVRLDEKADVHTQKLGRIERAMSDQVSRRRQLIMFAAAMIALAGAAYYYYLISSPFSARFKISGTAEVQALLRNRGAIQLFLGSKSETVGIDGNGEALFFELPAAFRNVQVQARLINMEGEPFMLLDSLVTLSASRTQNIHAKLLGIHVLHGKISDFTTTAAISNATVSIGPISTLTSINGTFVLKIPDRFQKRYQDIEVTKPGYLSRVYKNVPIQVDKPFEVALSTN
jgi:hypothetical protein